MSFLIIIIILTIIIIPKDYTIEILNKIKEIKFNMIRNEEIKTLSKFFNLNKINLTITLIITLLLTMVSVTNISRTFEGPLKKTYV